MQRNEHDSPLPHNDLAPINHLRELISLDILSLDKKYRQPAYELFDSYLDGLKSRETFVEISASERADYTSFHEYREDEPDILGSHKKERPLTNADLFYVNVEAEKPIRGIRVYKQGGPESDPKNYYTPKSLELYLLENGGLLECIVENKRKETPMNPTSHTTNKTYTLERKVKRTYFKTSEFLMGLSLDQIRDLLYDIEHSAKI